MDKCVSWYNIVSEYARLGVCPSGWGCNYRLKVSNTMSNTDTRNTRHCDQCAVLLTDENQGFYQWRDRCNRCHSRYDVDSDLLEIAYVANKLYSSKKTINELLHTEASLHVRVQELKKPVEADDYRVYHLWEKLYQALNGDIEQDETWGLIMDEIPGVPDLRAKTFEVEIPLESISITIEAKDEDEAIELAIEEAERDYCLADVINQNYIQAYEA